MRCPIESREPEILLAHGSGTLDAGRAAELREHLAVCRACRELAAGQQAVWQTLDTWEAPPVSPDFDRRLYSRIDNGVSWWERVTRPLRPLFARQGLPLAAAACLMIAIGVVVERPARVAPVQPPESAQVEAVSPDQVERALDDMEMLREFNHLVRPEAGEPTM